MRKIRSACSFGVLYLLGACAQQGVGPDTDALSDSAVPAPAAPEGNRRLSATERGFGASGQSWVAVNRARGILARIGADDVLLSGPNGELSLSFSGWGRGDELSAVPSALPTLGACTEEEDLGGNCIRRVELERGPVTEWWTNGSQGMQQGWELSERPDGDGPLTLVVEVQGADLDGDDAAVWLTDEAGGLWSYSDALAWDADGRALPAWLEVEGQEIRVRVDDHGAAWPIFVDPVMSTAGVTWTGTGSSDALGASVAGMGDLDGDGYDDVAVGVPGASSGTGAIYVYYGSSTGPGSTADLTLTGSSSSDAFGTALAMDGDVNDDGYADLAVGAPGVSSEAGAVYMFRGSSTGPATTASTTLTGSGTASAAFGSAVNLVGDVNGDGYDDVLIGEPGYASDTGRAWVYAGSSSGVSTSTYRTLAPSTTTGVLIGSAVSGGGDYNGDGYADMVVGAPHFYTTTPNLTGRAWVYAGKSTFFTTTPATSITYPGTAGYRYGSAVSLERSINADAYPDLIVGAPNGALGKGRVYVYKSTGTSLPAGLDYRFDGPEVYSEFSASLDVIGDTDGDGINELVIGAPNTTSGSGEVFVYAGPISSNSPKVANTLTGSSSSAYGTSVAGAGDVNADGYADLLIGAPDDGSGAGEADLFYGGADDDDDGYVVNGTGVDQDCDDTSASINPGATEVCDDADVDEDCDGLADDADDSVSGKLTWYEDGDDDGYGDPDVTTTACSAPTGYVGNSSDCDDGDAAINPDATEICDDADVDEDCDGLIDDADDSVSSAGMSTWYADDDGDAYGDPSSTTTACDLPSGYADNSDDCDDADDGVNPGATEVCDDADVDEDCDGVADDADSSVSTASKSTWYEDADSDAYGDPSSTTTACDLPSGYADNSDDCDDGDDGVNPAAAEVCDDADTDEDCDGKADDADSSVSAASKGTWYRDADSDDYGDPSSTKAACDLPSGYADNSDDCDDGDAAINPDATEVCDAADTDEDCDGEADDADSSVSAASKGTWYRDADADDYGDPSSTKAACDLPSGYADNSDDCDDGDADINPGAPEVCDATDVDEDCDGKADDADDSATGQSTWYRDADSDDFGDVDVTKAACDLPTGYVDNDDDCDDGDADINPDGVEVCDDANADEDCDGASDDADSSVSVDSKSTWYRDADSDDYGDADTTTAACDEPTGYVDDDQDCDDGDPEINPSATEVCDDADVDEDCDGKADDDDDSATGQSTWYRDADSDTYGDPDVTTEACDLSTGYVANSEDCDDGDDSIHPGGDEICDDDNADEDCDGLADDDDDSATGQASWYRDADTDGYGDPSETTEACDLPAGYSELDTDCDDTTSAISPAASEICDDADTDEDCDGLADDADDSTLASSMDIWYRDSDGDGWGYSDSTKSACDLPAGYADNALDCDDGDAEIRPDGAEVCDDADTDEDCDGLADDEDDSATGQTTWYADTDADGYGDPDSTIDLCDMPDNYIDNAEDCDDSSDHYHPGASESDCSDPNDYNCDGSTGYADNDEDGWAACEECDDSDASISPSATEIIGDSVDQDCDGSETCYADADGDGYVDGSGGTVESEDDDCLDFGEADADVPSGDCDDDDASAYPDAEEVCDLVDNDCDGAVDEDLATSIWYTDVDGDGYGDPDASQESCAQPDDTVDNADDCDDANAEAYPGATEIVGDGVDQDCDGEDATDTGGSDDSGSTDDSGGQETGEDTGNPKDEGGCGCASTTPRGESAALLALVAGLALARRRRRG